MCGTCCKHIDRAIENMKAQNIQVGFPYYWNEKGVCEMLKDNLCSVYENRPLICSVDKFAKEFKIKKKEFYRQNIIACNQMMDEDNIDLKYRIELI